MQQLSKKLAVSMRRTFIVDRNNSCNQIRSAFQQCTELLINKQFVKTGGKLVFRMHD